MALSAIYHHVAYAVAKTSSENLAAVAAWLSMSAASCGQLSWLAVIWLALAAAYESYQALASPAGLKIFS